MNRRTTRTTVERSEGSVIRTTEHWDGRRDVSVTPQTVAYKARLHKTGRKKGQVAEVERVQ